MDDELRLDDGEGISIPRCEDCLAAYPPLAHSLSTHPEELGSAKKRLPACTPWKGLFPGSTRQKRQYLTSLVLGMWLCISLSGVWLWQAWRAALLREAYIPQLRSMARREPSNIRLYTVLGARLAQTGQFHKAALVLRHAANLGSVNPRVWQAWAGSEVMDGKLDQARGTLIRGIGQNVPGLRESLRRWSSLGQGSSPAEIARAISPGGPPGLAVECARGSFLNGLAEWWGHLYPERSGFATRQAWVRASPGDAEAERLWGQALTANGDYTVAAKVLKRALNLAPHSLKIRLAIADLLKRERAANFPG